MTVQSDTDASHRASLPGGRELTLVALDPDRHAEVVHSWVVQPRARFWGMTDHTVEQVREAYAFVESLETHDAFLIELDESPIGVLQRYQPEHDPLGEVYDVQRGDVGLHLLLAAGDRGSWLLTDEIVPELVRFLFTYPGARRLVVEPDAGNANALRRMEREGFVLSQQVDLGHKVARLGFLTRADFEQRRHASP